jgi:hypothetical protein
MRVDVREQITLIDILEDEVTGSCKKSPRRVR